MVCVYVYWGVCVRERERLGVFYCGQWCVCVCGQWCVCVCVCVCVNDREFSSVDLNLLLSVKSLGESQR